MDDTLSSITLALGASWASGINVYAAILMLGIMHASGSVILPEQLQILADPLVMLAAGAMYGVEFFADKIPGVDTSWDLLHTFIRIPAGIMLAYGAADGSGEAIQLAAAIIGGALATATHVTKTGTRAAINTSPEPFSNWTASVTEDVAVIGGLWAALYHPWLFVCGLVVFIIFAIWILPKVWRLLKKVFGFILRIFGKEPPAEDEMLATKTDKTTPEPDTAEIASSEPAPNKD
jgi:hypothetical protein